MARDRDPLVNFERMWREMDELIGSSMASPYARRSRSESGFSPRVDVYYCGAEPQRGEREGRGQQAGEAGAGEPGRVEPRAIVKVELAGVDPESVGLEVSGRELVITGERPVQETEGRVYQQLEIEAGPFRRVVELGADVVAERARATYEDGILRVELPLRRAGHGTHRVPIDSPNG